MRRSAGSGAVLVFAPVLALLFAVSAVRADASEALIAAHFAARGATATQPLAREFLFEGGALVRTLQFEHSGCEGVFAWGGAGLRDVDLGFYSPSGQPLAEDRGSTPYGYVRLCAAAGTSLVVSAQAFAGRGELTLYRVVAAPRALGRLPDALPLATAAGGRVIAARAVGGEASELNVEAPLLHDERQLAAAGYLALGPPSLLEVRAGLAEGTLFLPAQRCFRVVAFVPGARGLLLELVAARAPGQGQDSLGEIVREPRGGEVTREARGADAELVRLALCQAEPTPVTVRVRTRALRSLAMLRVFEQPEARLSDAESYGEERALLLAEARLTAKSRGLRLEHLGEVWSERGPGVGWPLLSSGACIMLAALPAPGTEPELLLLDAAGNVLARNESRRGLSTVFTCVAPETALRAVVRGHAGAGPVSLWLGRGEAS
jgi:hypothetical protein